MQYALHSRVSQRLRHDYSPAYTAANDAYRQKDHIVCGWEPLRKQLLVQWNHLSAQELDAAGPNRNRLAALIQRKYGIASVLVENYLRNFERTLPVM